VVPTTFIIDRDGNVAAVHQGDVERAMFESEIKPLLNKSRTKKEPI
jgi:peroxiredoxin